MKYLDYKVVVRPGQAIVVTLDGAANVRVMDDANLSRYRRGEPYRSYGGKVRRSPAVVMPPTPGRWNVTIDLGGRSGRVQASVSVQ